MKLKQIILSVSFLALLTLASFPHTSLAESFTASPLIIDLNADPRDSSVHNIRLKNNENSQLRLYANVNEIELGESNEIKEFISASMSDRATSVTSWIEITRGRIELSNNEEKEIPLTVRVNPNAKPGLYHAYVSFASGHNRDESVKRVLNGQGEGVILRIVVGSKQEEFLRLVSFTTDRFSTSPEKGVMTYVLENTGDVPLLPSGDIRIYDNRGRELTVVEIKADPTQELLQPGEQRTYTQDLPYTDRIGRNKAFLNIEYGEMNRAAVYDTNFYFSIPQIYLFLIVILLILVISALFLLFRRGNKVGDYDPNEAHDLPMFVGQKKEHTEYEHDINLKNKDS